MLHERRRRVVGDAPQGGEDRARAGELEGTDQADQPLSSHLFTEPRVARRKRDQIRIEPQLIEDLPGLPQAVVAPWLWRIRNRKGQSGVERELLIEQAMAGEVEPPGSRRQLLDRLLGGIAAEKDSRIGEEARDCLHLTACPWQGVQVAATKSRPHLR